MAQRERRPARRNPFTPGPGTTPPHLAGRGRERGALNARLDGLQSGQADLRPVVLYGPRGMGKTVLLNRFARECADAGVNVITTSVETLLQSGRSLVKTLFPWRLDINDLGVALNEFALNVAFSSDANPALSGKLIRKCQRKPVALLLDEAHLIADKVDRARVRRLLQLCQEVAPEAPFLLALAGTPGLRPALKGLGSTYIERAEYLGVGLLDPVEAEAAIRVPLNDDGIGIADEALRFAVADGQRYPFFLQLWGAALWNRANEHGLESLSREDALSVAPAAGEDRVDLYHERYEEIRRNPALLAVAHAVAAAFAERSAISAAALERVASDALRAQTPANDERQRQAASLCEELVGLGFIWRPKRQREMVPGIPSLMEHFREEAGLEAAERGGD